MQLTPPIFFNFLTSWTFGLCRRLLSDENGFVLMRFKFFRCLQVVNGAEPSGHPILEDAA